MLGVAGQPWAIGAIKKAGTIGTAIFLEYFEHRLGSSVGVIFSRVTDSNELFPLILASKCRQLFVELEA